MAHAHAIPGLSLDVRRGHIGIVTFVLKPLGQAVGVPFLGESIEVDRPDAICRFLNRFFRNLCNRLFARRSLRLDRRLPGAFLNWFYLLLNPPARRSPAFGSLGKRIVKSDLLLSGGSLTGSLEQRFHRDLHHGFFLFHQLPLFDPLPDEYAEKEDHERGGGKSHCQDDQLNATQVVRTLPFASAMIRHLVHHRHHEFRLILWTLSIGASRNFRPPAKCSPASVRRGRPSSEGLPPPKAPGLCE